MRRERDGAVIEVLRGDITRQAVDAVVNAANARLAPGGGVAGAIHRAAGPQLRDACAPLGGCRTGEAKVTEAYRLPARWVVHTVGPVYGQDEPAAELLAASYRSSLETADYMGARSIAFPALSTGAFAYPVEEAAGIAFATLLDALPQQRSVRDVRMVLFDERATRIHERALAEQADARGWRDDPLG